MSHVGIEMQHEAIDPLLLFRHNLTDSPRALKVNSAKESGSDQYWPDSPLEVLELKAVLPSLAG